MTRLLLTLVLALGCLGLGPAADAKPAPVDHRLSRQQCSLLGRAWDDGCSRVACAKARDRMTGGRNAEVCLHGRHGHPYGEPVEFRTCAALHRYWIASVNWCASYPFRSAGVIEDSSWCRAPYTVYIQHAEVEGAYDECVRPATARKDERLAHHEGVSVGAVALDHSQVLCAQRPGTQYVDGRCQPVPPGTPAPAGGGIASIGDSVAWRSDDELARLRPDWALDDLPGRPIGALAGRLSYYESLHGVPGGLVVAVGANPTPGYTEADIDGLVAGLPSTTKVMLVLPYRANAQAQVVLDRYGEWMRRLAAERPLTCLADWRDLAAAHPHLMVDVVHPSAAGERAWASLVSNDWDLCPTS